MSLFSPFNEPHLQHSGTFNGNPVTMTAGYTTMEQLTVAELDRINQLGDSLRAELTDICRDVGVRAQITGIGSMGQIHFTPVAIRGWREVATADLSVRSLFHLLLLTKGLFFSKRLMFNISTPMRERQISLAAQIFRGCLVQLIPYLEVTAPSLLG
jgi:glutamate-1-semialdehyde 2,1-aminomutase